MAVSEDDQYGSVSGDDRVQLVAAWELVGLLQGAPTPTARDEGEKDGDTK